VAEVDQGHDVEPGRLTVGTYLEEWLAKQARKVLHVHRAIFTALRDAVRLQYVGRNIAEAVEPPKPRAREIAALEVRDIGRILQAVAEKDLEIPTLIALGTGMRRGEALGLRWRDIELGTGIAHCNAGLSGPMANLIPDALR